MDQEATLLLFKDLDIQRSVRFRQKWNHIWAGSFKWIKIIFLIQPAFSIRFEKIIPNIQDIFLIYTLRLRRACSWRTNYFCWYLEQIWYVRDPLLGHTNPLLEKRICRVCKSNSIAFCSGVAPDDGIVWTCPECFQDENYYWPISKVWLIAGLAANQLQKSLIKVLNKDLEISGYECFACNEQVPTKIKKSEDLGHQESETKLVELHNKIKNLDKKVELNKITEWVYLLWRNSSTIHGVGRVGSGSEQTSTQKIMSWTLFCNYTYTFKKQIDPVCCFWNFFKSE